MKLSISNIVWEAEQDFTVHSFMKQFGYSALEIAPTRIFPIEPYEKCEEAKVFKSKLMSEWELSVCSMQSIWYGRNERIFGSNSEREVLFEYTKKSIEFANAIGCKNLVFGCPKNRNMADNSSRETAVEFFRKIGDYALERKVVIAFEPNPVIYGTNFINSTQHAFEFVREVGSEGIKVNLDIGTIIQNSESLSIVDENFSSINHVHISEPFLAPIKVRSLHNDLSEILRNSKYDGYVSIEMKKCENAEIISSIMRYAAEVFA